MRALWDYIYNVFTFGAGWRRRGRDLDRMIQDAARVLERGRRMRTYTQIRPYSSNDAAYWDALSEVNLNPAVQFLLLDIRESFIRNMLHSPTEKTAIYVGGLRALDAIQTELSGAQTKATSLKEAQTNG